MGIAVAFIYMPIYVIFLFIAMSVAKGIRKRWAKEKVTAIQRYVVAGFTVSVLLTWTSIMFVPVKNNADYLVFFTLQLSLTLIAPSIMGGLFSTFYKRESSEHQQFYNSVMFGICFSIAAMPWIGFCLLYLKELFSMGYGGG
ncbi:hypothetical protein [Pleionea sp. CnH1-48]|uniref:hypothetical protein n=1 Tax=Pleionea sp. CnH1-48 TaxID=2954494 RepID=UPI00209845E8|nr:hypothetical protein [Pleionea sp. CnH1-48]MCO7224253.1 hypothetical protein [Pleionea sp. CnH1-48]